METHYRDGSSMKLGSTCQTLMFISFMRLLSLLSSIIELPPTSGLQPWLDLNQRKRSQLLLKRSKKDQMKNLNQLSKITEVH